MLVLPFDVSYADREDPYLVGRLLAEREGIAVWALRGLARLNAAQRFTVPRASADEMAFIAEAYSPLKAFTDSCCVLDGATTTSSAELYDAYRAWALNEQEPHILARKVFISAFKDLSRGRGCKYGTQRRGADVFRGFRGVAINTALTASAFAPALTVAG
jgi:putative DNA primase/helicase